MCFYTIAFFSFHVCLCLHWKQAMITLQEMAGQFLIAYMVHLCSVAMPQHVPLSLPIPLNVKCLFQQTEACLLIN